MCLSERTKESSRLPVFHPRDAGIDVWQVQQRADERARGSCAGRKSDSPRIGASDIPQSLLVRDGSDSGLLNGCPLVRPIACSLGSPPVVRICWPASASPAPSTHSSKSLRGCTRSVPRELGNRLLYCQPLELVGTHFVRMAASSRSPPAALPHCTLHAAQRLSSCLLSVSGLLDSHTDLSI